MKKFLMSIAVIGAFISTDVLAQDSKPLSPKETVKGTMGASAVEIIYCRPSARGRKMLGEKEKFGSVWRTGANDATSIEFSKAVKIEGKDLAAGKYALFTIPGEKEWTIIFNKNFNQMGAYEYSEDQDVLRVTVPAGKTAAFVETFTIGVEKDKVSLQWENTAVAFKVKG